MPTPHDDSTLIDPVAHPSLDDVEALGIEDVVTPTPVTDTKTDLTYVNKLLHRPTSGEWVQDADGRIKLVPEGPKGGAINYIAARYTYTQHDTDEMVRLGKNGKASIRKKVLKKIVEGTLGMKSWGWVEGAGEISLIFRFASPVDPTVIKKIVDRFPCVQLVMAIRFESDSQWHVDADQDSFDPNTLLATAPVNVEKIGKSLFSRAVYLRKQGFAARLAYNIFADVVEIDGKAMEDATLLRLREGIEQGLTGEALPTDAMRELALLLAHERSYDPVVDWLDKLNWDGKDRLADFVKEHFGGDNPDGTADLFRRWLISAVARQYQPGCQADLMLVLQGRQGWGKDRFFRALLPTRDWYLEEGVDVGGENGNAPGIRLRGKMVVHFPEMAALSKREHQEVKKFLTLTRDEYRRAHAHFETMRERRCVFAGSTNAPEPLTDDTGNRRYIVIKVEGKFDDSKMLAIREQVWAQAVTLYHAGQRWHLTAEEEVVQVAINEPLMAIDPVLLRVEAWGVMQQKPFTIEQALDAVGIGRGEQGRWAGKSGTYLKNQKFNAERVQSRGVRSVMWIHPTPQQPPQDPVVADLFPDRPRPLDLIAAAEKRNAWDEYERLIAEYPAEAKQHIAGKMLS